MKKLFRNILLFLVPVLVLILFLPVHPRLKYIGLKHDCFNHAIWVYDRIFNNPKPVNIAFLGSSHTINGIDDSLIEHRLMENVSVVNFGYCRLGRNLSYVLLKELLKKKHPEYVFLEVREDEDYFSHPVFPYLASDRDVLFPHLFFDEKILSDIWLHFSYKVELLQDVLFSENILVPVRTNNFGYAVSSDTASPTALQQVLRKQRKPVSKQTSLIRDFHLSFARGYLKKIHNLCTRRKIKLIFLYLPSYDTSLSLRKPKEYSTYQKYGKVWIPPERILTKQDNWHDEGHLNREGSRELSMWLAGEIKRLLTKQEQAGRN